jgi:hypothetical protein
LNAQIATDFSGGMVRDNPEINKRVADMTVLGRDGVPDDVMNLTDGSASVAPIAAHLFKVALETAQCAPVPKRVRPGLTTSSLQQSNLLRNGQGARLRSLATP